MDDFLEIGIGSLLDINATRTDQIVLFVVYPLAMLFSLAVWISWIDPKTAITTTFKLAVASVAAQSTPDVRSAGSSQPQAPPPFAPAPLSAPAPPALHSSGPSSAATLPRRRPLPRTYAWERPDWTPRSGQLPTQYDRPLPSVFRTEIERNAFYDNLRKQPTAPQRRALAKKQLEAEEKKATEAFYYDLAAKTLLPVPEKPKRTFLCAPRGYETAYNRFQSTFRPSDGQISGLLTTESASGNLHTALIDVLPPRYDTSLLAPPVIAVPIPPSTPVPAAIAPTNGAAAPTPSIWKPFQPVPVPMNNAPGSYGLPGNERLIPAPQPPRVEEILLPPPPVFNTSAPAPAPIPPVGSIGAALGSGNTTGTSAGTNMFGNPTTTSSSDNDLLSMSLSNAQTTVDQYTGSIQGFVSEMRAQIAKSTLSGAWKAATGSAAKQTKIRNLAAKVKNICDWATGPGGSVDEQKLPRAMWQSHGLTKMELDGLVAVLVEGRANVFSSGPIKVVDAFIKQAKRAQELFK